MKYRVTGGDEMLDFDFLRFDDVIKSVIKIIDMNIVTYIIILLEVGIMLLIKG